MKKTLSLLVIAMMICTTAAYGARAKVRPIAPQSVGRVTAHDKLAAAVMETKKPALQPGAGAPTKPDTQANTQPNSGSNWRAAGLIGGSMLLGSLLSSMFGFGHIGFVGPLFGIIINLLMAGALFLAVRYVRRKLIGPGQNNYRRQ